MDDCRVIQAIRTNLMRRGDGMNTYVRCIEQYWDFDGRLLWENDPCKDNANVEPRKS